MTLTLNAHIPKDIVREIAKKIRVNNKKPTKKQKKQLPFFVCSCYSNKN